MVQIMTSILLIAFFLQHAQKQSPKQGSHRNGASDDITIVSTLFCYDIPFRFEQQADHYIDLSRLKADPDFLDLLQEKLDLGRDIYREKLGEKRLGEIYIYVRALYFIQSPVFRSSFCLSVCVSVFRFISTKNNGVKNRNYNIL